MQLTNLSFTSQKKANHKSISRETKLTTTTTTKTTREIRETTTTTRGTRETTGYI